MIKTNREYIAEYNQLLKECDMVYHLAAAKLDMSDCAFWILYTLHDSGQPIKQSDICDSASMPRQTVNSALKKLEKDGYLTLSRIDGKMGKSIHLTDKGEQLVHKHIVPVMRAEEKACALFTDEEKTTFLSAFHTLVERLNHEISALYTEGK